MNFLTNDNSLGSTHILRIVNYNIESKNNRLLPDAIFFDFGGQDFYHGVYKAFVSENALQLILFNQDTDYNEIGADVNGIPIINFNRNFWLGQKNYQEHNKFDKSSYILIQTYDDSVKHDSIPIDYLNYPGHLKSFSLSLKSKYESGESSHIQEFYNIGKQYFKKFLDSTIDNCKVSNTEPLWYANFLKYILNRETKTHTASSITGILENYGASHLTETERRESLITNLTQLHRFGLILYYPDIDGLSDIAWLNPQMLVEHIQNELLAKTLIDIETGRRKGIIPKAVFEDIVTDKAIVLLLKAQNVIFLHEPSSDLASHEYIIPNYLPLSVNDDIDMQLFTFGLEQPKFVIKFNDFIPFGFINQMICFFGKLPDVKRFWRDKLLFTINKDARVLIDIDFTALKIKVNFQTLKNASDVRDNIVEYLFFSIIALYWNISVEELFSFKEFMESVNSKTIDKSINDVKAKIWEQLKTMVEFVPEDAYISLDDEYFVSYFDLFNLPEEVYTIDGFKLAQNKINTYKPRAIQISQFKSFTSKKLSIMKKIFVSYSKFDEDYLQDFEDHLITLKNEGVATFNCKKIEFGKEWDEEIKKQIEDCDIMVCLISVKFLNTSYISDIEIPRAIDLKKLIIPIIIKPCDWENSPLGKFQAAQRGKVVAMDNGKKLFGEIRAQTREERDAFWTDVIKEFRAKITFS